MTKLIIETYRNAIFLDLRICRLWMEIVPGSRAPFPPHPQDRRWGIHKDEGETCLYLGSLFVIFTPWATIKQEREAAAIRREQMWAQLAQ